MREKRELQQIRTAEDKDNYYTKNISYDYAIATDYADDNEDERSLPKRW